ncbi:integrase arm-type DNA-binding domain-containing protein [Rhodanobacter denitrificans]|nr:integrase arm-type DNA-binding domain-containing protein [Rhodanobacter denitrificans]
MPKKAKELSPLAIKRLSTEPGLHAVGGVAGLQLQVRGGAVSWILRVLIGGKRRDVGLGGYPSVTLSDARDKARSFRAKIDAGVDPVAERQAARASLMTALTFDEAAKRAIAVKAPEFKNAKHLAQWQSTLDTYASPLIGKLPVDKIDARHVYAVLDPIWTTKTETASRLRGRIEFVLDWATAAKHRTGDNPARWKGNLQPLLGKPSKLHKVKHHAALPATAMPGFIEALRQCAGIAARALEFAILTAARSIEVRGAAWSEIDVKAATWTVPAERMKAGKEHRVPLSPQALALLAKLPRMKGADLVFPAPRGGVLSDMTLSAVMKRMKVDAVPHGFRSTFRDWASEISHYPQEMAEMALAHAIGNKVEAAYRRGDLLAKRTHMMTDWANFIETKPATGNVTKIRRKA